MLSLFAAQTPAFAGTAGDRYLALVTDQIAQLDAIADKLPDFARDIERDGSTVAGLRQRFEAGEPVRSIAAKLMVIAPRVDRTDTGLDTTMAKLRTINKILLQVERQSAVIDDVRVKRALKLARSYHFGLDSRTHELSGEVAVVQREISGLFRDLKGGKS